jgi:hypothetical protein
MDDATSFGNSLGGNLRKVIFAATRCQAPGIPTARAKAANRRGRETLERCIKKETAANLTENRQRDAVPIYTKIGCRTIPP